MTEDVCAVVPRGKRTMGYPIDYTNELSIYALPRLHNDNSANWKQRDHLLMIGWSCCYRCIKSWGDDRSGCMRVPVHSMIVDETLEVMWNHIMIFALDKCNDVVMGSWGITGYVNVSIFIPECGGPSVDSFGIVCTMWVRRLRNILRVPSSLLYHAIVKTMMHFRVYY